MQIRNEQLKKENGITLVTLAITVVVLLILAGVTINTVLGDNGIITQAKEAAELTKRASVISSVQLDILTAEMEGTLTQEKLEEILNKYGTVEKNDPENPDKITGVGIEGVTDSIPIEELYPEEITGGEGDTPVNPPDGTDTTAPEVSISLSATSAKTGTLVTATVTHTDNKSEVDINNCKYLYNTTSGNLGTTNAKWDTANSFNTNPQTIDLLATTEGTYYLHVLTVDTAGNKGEKVSEGILVTATGSSTGDVENPINPTDTTNNGEIYGKIVTGYTCTNSSACNWKVFYEGNAFSTDGKSHIYLIADDYIKNSYCPPASNGSKVTANGSYKANFTNIVGSYKGSASITDSAIKKLNNDYFIRSDTSAITNNNMKAVAYMLDTNAWSVFKGSNADYAIGGPTVEILLKSYSQKYDVNYRAKTSTTAGYVVSSDGEETWANGISNMLRSSDSTYVISSQSKATGLWLASPSAYDTDGLMCVDYDGNVNGNIYYSSSTYYGFRPLVCLSSGVKLVEQSDGTFKIQ